MTCGGSRRDAVFRLFPLQKQLLYATICIAIFFGVPQKEKRKLSLGSILKACLLGVPVTHMHTYNHTRTYTHIHYIHTLTHSYYSIVRCLLVRCDCWGGAECHSQVHIRTCICMHTYMYILEKERQTSLHTDSQKHICTYIHTWPRREGPVYI